MRLATKLGSIALGVAVAGWLLFSWFEAEREIRILCSLFHPGLDREQVVSTLETGGYLRYRTEADAGEALITVDSVYNLGSSRCAIELQGGRVVVAVYE